MSTKKDEWDGLFKKADPIQRKSKESKKKEPVDVMLSKEQYNEENDLPDPIILLSLDPANSCGWSIFHIYKGGSLETPETHLIKCDFLEVETKEDGYIGDSCISLQNQIRDLIKQYNVQQVCVEDYFMSSRKCQGANMNVYFRGSIYILCRELGIHYDIIPIWGWKSFVAGQTTPGKQMKKYYGKELANKVFIQEALWSRYKLRFPNYSISKKTNKPVTLRYDMIDSVGIGLYHVHKRHNCFMLVNKLVWPLGLNIKMNTKRKSFQYED